MNRSNQLKGASGPPLQYALACGLAAAAAVVMSSCGGMPGLASARQSFQITGLASGLAGSFRANNNPATTIASAAPGFSARPSGSFAAIRPDAFGRFDTGNALMATGTCGFSTSPTTLVDADADGSPVSGTYSYDYDSDACGTTAAGIKYTFKGTTTSTDLDDTKKWFLGGFKSTWDYLGTFKSPSITTAGRTFPAATYSYTGKGNYSGAASGSNLNSNATYSGKTTYTVGAYNGSYAYEGVWTSTLTPDTLTNNDFYLKGKFQMDGSWTYSGLFLFDQDQGSTESPQQRDVTFTATSIGAEYDSTCSQYWRKGTFRYNVGGGHKWEQVYDCTKVTYYFDGKVWDPATDK